jgi:hypothetical protein
MCVTGFASACTATDNPQSPYPNPIPQLKKSGLPSIEHPFYNSPSHKKTTPKDGKKLGLLDLLGPPVYGTFKALTGPKFAWSGNGEPVPCKNKN